MGARDRGMLAVCGDPIVGRALTLLLTDLCYDVRFLPSSTRPDAFADVRLFLLTPGAEEVPEAVRFGTVPVLELAPFGTKRETLPLRLTVPWPCHTETLRRHIEAVLLEGRPWTDPSQAAGRRGGDRAEPGPGGASERQSAREEER